jgi:hypothetical protein
VLEDPDALICQRVEQTGVDIGCGDKRRIAGLLGEPPGDGPRTGSDLQATSASAESGSTNGSNAERIDARLKQA